MNMLSARDIPPRAAGVVVVLALLASIVTGREQAPALETPPPAPTTPATAQPQPADLPLDKLVRTRTEHNVQDLFATQSRAPAAVSAPPEPLEPAAPQPPAPAVPIAPPLPFTYLGRMLKGEHTLYYLLKGDDMLLVENGQTLGEYRVEGVGESSLSFLYLPSGARQTLALPAKE